MSKLIVFSCALAGVLSVQAVGPRINADTVKLTQASSREVSVEYKLADAPAVVTVDIQTNAGNNVWISLGAAVVKSLSGDVNKVVQPGECKILWDARADMPPIKLVGMDVARAVVTAWSLQSPPDYMVIDLSQDVSKDATADNVRYYTSVDALPDGGLANDVYRTTKLVMRRIPAAGATYRMGSPVGEYNRSANEVPHLVELTKDYYMAIYETTASQAWTVLAINPGQKSMVPAGGSSFNAWRGPAAEGYDWPKNGHTVKSTSIVGNFRARTGFATFDLPTEAQWEFACRAGTETGWPTGYNASDAAALKKFAVIWSTASGSMLAVGSLDPNRWGLYDMIGNAGEYCLDWYGAYDATDTLDPKGPASGTDRVRRGTYAQDGTFGNFSSAKRGTWAPGTSYTHFGCRLICDAVAVR